MVHSWDILVLVQIAEGSSGLLFFYHLFFLGRSCGLTGGPRPGVAGPRRLSLSLSAEVRQASLRPPPHRSGHRLSPCCRSLRQSCGGLRLSRGSLRQFRWSLRLISLHIIYRACQSLAFATITHLSLRGSYSCPNTTRQRSLRHARKVN